MCGIDDVGGIVAVIGDDSILGVGGVSLLKLLVAAQVRAVTEAAEGAGVLSVVEVG